MRVLAIDTSTDICSVAVLRDDEIISEEERRVKDGHSGSILQVIDEVLKGSRVEMKDIDMIAVGVGPGSFTGIRIGIATAKGLAHAVGCGIRGVITLDAVAANAAGSPKNIMPVLDARKGEIFCALYGGDGKRLSQLVNIEPSRVGDMVDGPTLFVGNAIAIYDETFKKCLGNDYHAVGSELWYPKAGAIGVLAQKEDAGTTPVNPVYVRPSDADLLLRKKFFGSDKALT